MCERNHRALKTDDAAWNLLELVGRQLVEADPDEPGSVDQWLELRDCTCGSTLGRLEKSFPG